MRYLVFAVPYFCNGVFLTFHDTPHWVEILVEVVHWNSSCILAFLGKLPTYRCSIAQVDGYCTISSPNLSS